MTVILLAGRWPAPQSSTKSVWCLLCFTTLSSERGKDLMRTPHGARRASTLPHPACDPCPCPPTFCPGRMELLSRAFFPAVRAVLDSPRLTVLGTIPCPK